MVPCWTFWRAERSDISKMSLSSLFEHSKEGTQHIAHGLTNPHFPALRSSHELSQRPSPKKQFPSSEQVVKMFVAMSCSLAFSDALPSLAGFMIVIALAVVRVVWTSPFRGRRFQTPPSRTTCDCIRRSRALV
jgi:hypothetical protein